MSLVSDRRRPDHQAVPPKPGDTLQDRVQVRGGLVGSDTRGGGLACRVIDAEGHNDAAVGAFGQTLLTFSPPTLPDIAAGVPPNTQVVGGERPPGVASARDQPPDPSPVLRVAHASDEGVTDEADAEVAGHLGDRPTRSASPPPTVLPFNKGF